MLTDEFSIEAARRMVQKYDFVITSGGIGPTHDGLSPDGQHLVRTPLTTSNDRYHLRIFGKGIRTRVGIPRGNSLQNDRNQQNPRLGFSPE